MNEFMLDFYIQNQTETKYSPKFSSFLENLLLIAFTLFGLVGILLIFISIVSKKRLYKNQLNILILSQQLNGCVCFILNCLLIKYPYESLTSLQCNILFYSCMFCVGCTLWHYVVITLNQYLINKQSKLNKMKLFTFVSMFIPRFMSMLAFSPSLVRIEQIRRVFLSLEKQEYLLTNLKQIQNCSFITIDFLLPWLIVTCLFISIFLMGYTQSQNDQVNYLNGDAARRLIENHRRRNAFDDESTLNSMRNESARVRNENANLDSRKQSSRLKRREINMIKRFLSIIVLFIFGYLPFGVSLFTNLDNLNFYDLLKNWFVIITSISPIIIISTNSKIYRQIKQCLNRFRRRLSQSMMKNKSQMSRRRSITKRVYFTTPKSQHHHLECVKENDATKKTNVNKLKKEEEILKPTSIYHKRSFVNRQRRSSGLASQVELRK